MAVATNQDLLVNVSVDLADSKKSIAQLNAQFSDLIKTMNSVHDTQKKSAQETVGLLTKVGIAYTAAKVAATGFYSAIRGSVAAFVESEEAGNRLANSLRISGQYSEEALSSLDRFATQLSKNSSITDEQARSLLSYGLALGKTTEEAEMLAQAAVDLAAATGTDVDTAMSKLNATFSGSAMGIAKMIPAVKNLTEAQLKNGEAVKLVAERFRGFAQAGVDTLPGSLNQARKAVEEASEAFGKAFSNAFDLKTLSQNVTSFMNVFRVMIEQSSGAFEVVARTINFTWNSMNLLFQKSVEYAGRIIKLLAKIPGVSSIVNAEEVDRIITEYESRAEQSFANMAEAYNPTIAKAEELKQKSKGIGENFKSAAKEVEKFGAEAQKTLNDIEAQNQKMAVDLVMSDLSQQDQIKARLALELQSIENKMTEIKANEKLNELEKKRLLTGLENQKELAEASAKKEGDKAKSGGFMGGVSKITGAVSQFGGWVGAIVQAIGSLGSIIQELNKMVINLFNGLSNLGDEMKKLVPELVASLLKFTEEFLPEFIEMFFNTSLMMTEMLNKLPEATFKALSKLPQVLIKALGETLPKLLEEMFQLLIATPVEIIEKVLDALWSSMSSADFQKIIGNIIQAIIRGIIKANQSAIRSMLNIASIIGGKKIKIDEKSVKDTLDTVSKKLTGATSQVFAVTELTAAAGREKVENIAEESIEKLRSFWEEMLQMLEDAWKYIKEIFWDPMIAIFRGTWEWVNENVVAPLIEGLNTVWLWVYENVVQPIGESIMKAWGWVNENIITPLKDAFAKIFDPIYDKLIKPIQEAFSGIWSSFKWPEFRWPEFTWPEMNPTLKLDVSDKLKKLLGLARGGMVPLYAADGAFVPRGTDTVPAMLTPGEFVVQRSAVQSLGVSAMNSINQGRMPQGNTSVNIDMKIETTEPIDEAFVRSKLLPKIKEEFRRSSLDGAFILAGSGIRR